ncbi:hypothetical protein ACFXDJ_02515 [Streptomyces sp. NPDC059443]|uniref:hypothetical protein n=1 Tax=unclassified Streptomyces TaxID=2593676 RepID=UPI0036C2024A
MAGFSELVALALPDGLVRTELLRGQDGRWRIQTLWRDHAALDVVRATPGGAPAPKLFREVGADPALALFDVEVRRTAPVEPA